MQTFSVQTLGCKVNQYESEQLAALLQARGLRPVESGGGADADLRIINTCSVTAEAAAKSRQQARRAARLAVVSLRQFACNEDPSPSNIPTGTFNPPHGRRSRVVVTGCWATSDRATAETLEGVDAVIGHHQDVAAELTRLLDLWQGCGEETVPQSTDRYAAPEPLGNDGWIKKAGSPAGTSNNSITLSSESNVNGKIARDVLSFYSGPPRGTTALPLLSSRQTGRQRAYLKIQDGCDAHCTYCIIPSLRPALWSKPVADVVAEANQLVAAGHVELVLTGIFLGAYGHPTALRRRRQRTGPNFENAGTPLDLRGCETVALPRRASGEPRLSSDVSSGAPAAMYGGTTLSPLATLTDALCTGVPGLKRLRFSSLEPGDLNADLIAALRSHPQVVPHFHLPLQSGSNLLLRRMNRQYTREDYLQMIERVRDAFDRPALTTDIIVGFPGERDAEFERTLEVARHCRFIHIHAFPFSPRPGTAAARWTDQFVPGDDVSERIEMLRALSEADSLTYRQQFVGQTAQILVEGEKGEDCRSDTLGPTTSVLRHGRCERYFPIHFEDRAARPGDFVRVRIESVDGARTLGTKINSF